MYRASIALPLLALCWNCHAACEVATDGSDTISLRVTDDGRGFRYDEVALEAGRHYGLLSMRERAEASGGHFHISSRVGQGTTIEAVVAVEASPERAYANA